MPKLGGDLPTRLCGGREDVVVELIIFWTDRLSALATQKNKMTFTEQSGPGGFDTTKQKHHPKEKPMMTVGQRYCTWSDQLSPE